MEYLKLIAVILIVGILVGCDSSNDKRLSYPAERANLVSRFFKSMENNDNKDAVIQATKLITIDSANSYLGDIIAIQQSNEYLKVIQTQLNQGNINKALEIAKKGASEFPLNRILANARNTVMKLHRASKYINEMQKAKSIDEMRSSLAMAKANLSGFSSVESEKFFKDYAKKITEKEKKRKNNR